MPCSDGGPSYEQLREQRAIPAVLCAVLTVLEATGQFAAVLDKADWAEAGVDLLWVEGWWKQHKSDDARRRKLEAESREREQAKRAVLGKLSGEEKSILGLE